MQAGLTEGQLGLALLGMPLGAIAIMAFMGPIIHRFGAGRVTWVSSIVYIFAMVLPALATNWWSLAGALVIVGFGAGSMDVAMNAAAAAIEKQYQRLIMSTSHAVFSLGGMIGAGMGSIVVGLGVPPLPHFIYTVVIMLVVAFVFRKQWLSISEQSEGSHKWVWPTRSLALLAFIGFCVLLSEGAIADWSAVYLRHTLGGSSFIGGLGFAGFSLTMALGRFYGDSIIPRWGAGNLLRWGGLVAAVSLGTALIIGNPLVAILGFTVAGLGLSCVVPITFSAAARIPGISPGGGIAAISSLGYIGFMVGPPAIGFMADQFGLTFGLGLVAVLCLLFAMLAGGINTGK
jgi:MFS family permease